MMSFPIDAVIFNKIIEVFNQSREYVLLLFPLAFFVRIAFGFIFLKTESFIDILKDSLFLFLGLFFFTDILKMTLQIPYFVASELSAGDFKNINLSSGIFTKALKRLVDWIGIITYWISFGLYIVIVCILGFFSAYILFFGTMFRLYGLLKVFFILLFTVSLWPLLWHSINFAVLTIAVSDNAFSNNVIVGGASLAKVFIPIWLISKSSKIPVGKTLKKFSLTSGSMAVAGSSYASSFFNNKSLSQSFRNEQETSHEINNRQAEISFSEIEAKQSFKNDEDYLNNPVDDFSFDTDKKSLEFQNSNQKELSFEEDKPNNTQSNLVNEKALNETNTILEEQTLNQEASSEEIVINREIALNEKTFTNENIVSNTNEIKTSQSISNESLLNETKGLDTEQLSNPNFNQKTESFNARAKENWDEERDNPNSLSQKETNNKGGFEL